MAKFIKIILFMLFAVALHCVANNYFAGEQAEQDTYMAMSVLKGDMHETVSSPQAPYFPDAELAGAGIQVHQIAMSRIQRIQAAEYVLSLKGLAQRLADRDAALSQHWGKLYDTTTSYCCHPVSEYYVFALRRIIV
ncbi:MULTISPECIES: hypothetical protein [Bacteroides]|uniref:hypothetical protein n=1 Tax=Bacteroides fragilis TaxID=817 RepID=UPI00228E087F|nr:hypothetical protein [Bacteroides fragilis]MCY6292738.1 hypothetical protein [Bacteroides fragilis]MCZ2622128.1 hypothetical protein [Bacteroides fragilis]